MQTRNASPDLGLADIKADGRLRLHFSGIVQGVGFRPFLYRAAEKFGLKGFVKNTSAGVTMEVEGGRLGEFVRHIVRQAPPLSLIETLRFEAIPIRHSAEFTILESDARGQKNVLVSPDIALCRACQKEMAAIGDRRHAYPFTNCTDCGPRFTIIEDLPYDRPQTTMKRFTMCPDCRREYQSPADRRYHAQPVSCPHCGPKLKLLVKGREIKGDALAKALKILRADKVLAVKGIGGFHLACRAASATAIARLRHLKQRNGKPFALMAGLEMIREHCLISQEEKELLNSPAAPIVLLGCPAGKQTHCPYRPGSEPPRLHAALLAAAPAADRKNGRAAGHDQCQPSRRTDHFPGRERGAARTQRCHAQSRPSHPRLCRRFGCLQFQ